MQKAFYILLAILLFSLSCTEENLDDTPDIDSSYFPLTEGSYIVYEITEITIDAPSEVYDTVKYECKELIGSPYIDNSGNLYYMLIRYTRDNSGDNWALSDVWSTQIADNSAQQVEENIRYVKLRFPVHLNKSWDGNVFNINDAEEYRITEIDAAWSINQTDFDSVLTVVQEADSSLIHKDVKTEKYTKHLGLIYKEETQINSQNVIPDVPLEERITTATIYIKRYKSNGESTDYEV